eukprot:scaffold1760_cov109-Isochrysis_galbana.AAC.6
MGVAAGGGGGRRNARGSWRGGTASSAAARLRLARADARRAPASWMLCATAASRNCAARRRLPTSSTPGASLARAAACREGPAGWQA